MPAEIILIGGASILINYGFRDSTLDMDALIVASSAMKEAINHVGDEFGLPNGWINTDFKQTKSYSTKLTQYSIHYKTFSHILEIRTVSAEYLVAMKLMAGRKYKHDLSDVVGILLDRKKWENPYHWKISKEQQQICTIPLTIFLLTRRSLSRIYFRDPISMHYLTNTGNQRRRSKMPFLTLQTTILA
ncbi:MAG: DUF6036 family nucleotidyltransferase [Bilifractor sp.]